MNALDPVLDALRAKGCDPRKTKDGYQATCPAHDDSNPSLSVTEKDGKVLLHCHTGCSTEAVVQALGLEMAQLFNGRGGGVAPSQKQRNTATGLTLEQYAKAKHLSLDFLKGLGMEYASYYNPPAVRIPYFDGEGDLKATRFRTALEGPDRFRWKKSDKPIPYGLDRFADARTKGFVVLVEGESDAHTLWFHDVPALGIPGAATWKDEWAEHLDDVQTVYVVREPDDAGSKMVEKIAKGNLRAKLRILDLDPWKDPSEMHVAGESEFREWWEQKLSDAVSLEETQRQEAKRAGDEAWELCRHIAGNSDILAEFAYEIGQTVSGDLDNAKILYLVLVSRLFDKPCSAIVKGESSAGKSYLVQQVLEFFPPSAYLSLTGMSPKALLYQEEPLKHRTLFLAEFEHNPDEFYAYALRSILSEGRLTYSTLESTSQGIRPKALKCEGPTGLITTTTAPKVHPENETRMISLKVSYTEKTGRAVLAKVAENENRLEKPDRSAWQALQVWLESGERRVLVPFARRLGELFPAARPRAQRDFMQILSLVRAHALLHRENRNQDTHGRIVAEIGDYGVVAHLMEGPLAKEYAATVAPIVRDTVRAVERLLSEGREFVSQRDLAKATGLDKSTISRRVGMAIESGFLVNHQSDPGRSHWLELGEPLPTLTILPSAAEVLRRCAVSEGDGVPLPPPDLSANGDSFFLS